MNLPTLRQLQYFLAVVELKHFGQAAERCFVSQSTLSSGIQELEAVLGGALFERNKRKVMITPLGYSMKPKAEQVVEQASDMVKISKGVLGTLVGQLRLGIIPTVGPFLLPKVLPEIRKRFTDLKLLLAERQSVSLLEQLNNGQIDCAIMALPYDLKGLEYALICEENFCIALPPGHPLAKSDEAMSSDQLPSDEIMLLEEGHCLRDHAIAACHWQSSHQRTTVQGTSLYTMIEMVAGGQGITLLPAMAAKSVLVEQSSIHLRPLSEPGPHRQIALVWRPTYSRKEDLQALVACMRECLA